MLTQLPSADIIAKYSRRIEQARPTSDNKDAAYYHSRYLVRKERNLAKGLNSAGQPIKNPNRKTWPELAGLPAKEYEAKWRRLNPRKGH